MRLVLGSSSLLSTTVCAYSTSPGPSTPYRSQMRCTNLVGLRPMYCGLFQSAAAWCPAPAGLQMVLMLPLLNELTKSLTPRARPRLSCDRGVFFSASRSHRRHKQHRRAGRRHSVAGRSIPYRLVTVLIIVPSARSYSSQLTSVRISHRRSGMSTMTSWPHATL